MALTPNLKMLNSELDLEERKEVIRALRFSCFEIVNRGGLWYDRLSLAEKDELLLWYQEWLDAPETGVVPEKPQWLD